MLLLAVAAKPVPADDSADYIERANLLRKLLEDVPPVGASNSSKELPAARLEREQHNGVEQLRIQQFQDAQWRQLLESQRSSAHRQDAVPSPGSPGSALSFERDQRARDLQIQIQRQDLQYRQNNRR